jgi:2-oxoglutarate dehydrogenase E1 component
VDLRLDDKTNCMSEKSEPKLGINSWLQEELYQNYLHDKKNVDDTWKRVFETNGHGTPNGAKGNGAAAAPVATPAAKPAAAPPVVPPAMPAPATGDQLVPLRGVAAKIAENMTVSLTVPTATSQRMIPVRVIEEKRQQINERRAAAGQGKISYTHLISWAIVRALDEFPSLNHAFAEQNGELFRVVHKDVNIGIAVDVKAKDGSSSLMVPNIKNAGAMNFGQFLAAFDDVVSRARNGKLQMPDFQGTTISLTNPGTVGTLGSVPRLVAGQGAIIATGAMDYPAEYQTVTAEMKAHIGISKVMMITCTYDHRIIQGAESGRFLGKLQALLNGETGFYDKIFTDLGIIQPLGPSVTPAVPVAASTAVSTGLSTSDALKEAAAAFLINAYRVRGHLIADLDPLGSKRPMHPDLELATHGLTEADLDRPLLSQAGKTLRTVIEELRKTYCDKIASEYMYIQYPDQKEWLRERMESTLNAEPLDQPVRLRILDRLIEGEEFEHFLDKRYIGKKRFSIEGGESALVMLDETLDRAANAGAKEAVLGMAHRGRLTILANICNKPLVDVFSDFDEAPGATANRYSTGDVKYHLGAHGTRTSTQGKEIGVSMAFNPSHLEAVDPVVEGMVRTMQDQLGDAERDQVIPILIHGDAAFAGQGVVPETLNLSQLPGYATGGTVHLIINNQVGFTTAPEDGRSGPYASDVARAIQAPIFHVNGDDPEAVLRVSRMAFDFRQKFNRDVVIDLLCYRRLGHNEGDDPSFTQPVMYKKIKAQSSVVAKYADRLTSEGVVDKADVDGRKKAYVARLSEAFDLSKTTAATELLQFEPEAPVQFLSDRTTIDVATAELVVNTITSMPADFHVHPKLKPLLEKRKTAITGEPFDWGTGEALAFGSLLTEGYSVRLSGQDVGRGTFSHRHMELYDYEDGHKYIPLQQLAKPEQRCEVWGSSLSEYAAMGFEFGFSLASPSTLVMWEAQFGDFVNGAQIVLDQFLSSSEKKWGELCGLVLLLPHGYEGLGPEHSSARIERFLQMCAQENMQVANCTTPAQYFHILRRQLRGGADGKPIRKPLIIFTPKSLLRNPLAVSRLEDLTSGKFEEVLRDTGGAPAAGVKRILLCSGKIYYDLQERRKKTNANHVAILRVEQMYPFPKDALQAALQEYPSANEYYWVQEEPKNMGPWRFMQENIQPLLDGMKRTLRHVTRPESASPAVGTDGRHKYEQNEVVDDAFAEKLVARSPKRPKLIKKKK